MKILFVSSGNNKSFDIVPFIREQGESIKALGVQVDYYPIIGKGFSGYIKAGFSLRKFLKDKDYDLIHAHFTLSGWAAIIGSKNLPVILSLMGSDAYGEYIGVNKVQFKSRLSTLLTLLIQPMVKAIISKSANIERFVYQKEKSFIIPNGINRNKFKPIEIQHDHPIPSKKKILFLGNKNNVRKNYSLAKAAVDRLNRNDVELINPYPVAHQEIPVLMNSADVLLVPSLMEGSPNVVKEAMACNCPIVATDIGDVKWVVGDTEGCYVSSFDIEEFSQKISQALTFAETKGRTQGENRISELGLDAETVARKVIDIYNAVLGTKKYPSNAINGLFSVPK